MPHTTGRIAIRCYKFEFLLRPLRSLRLISESDYSYFVTFVPFVEFLSRIQFRLCHAEKR